ncbi:hypothetical protein [Pseudoalteromonas marina]|uniref:Lipoprotein n=1 Tax=Pseudoalteromonas marina TaxID=267375 RepID=A0ABT9FG63_9GAMM|nr:hypothetical protein [Pseudoalteromonas marina]MDP2565770.1 hypothetical protein [Pseudoalteromonas marina]
MTRLILIFLLFFLVGCGDNVNEKASKGLSVSVVNELKKLKVDSITICKISSVGGFLMPKTYRLGVFEGESCVFTGFSDPLVTFDVSRTKLRYYGGLTLKFSGAAYDVYVNDEVKSIPYSDFKKSLAHYLNLFIKAKKEGDAIEKSWL